MLGARPGNLGSRIEGPSPGSTLALPDVGGPGPPLFQTPTVDCQLSDRRDTRPPPRFWDPGHTVLLSEVRSNIPSRDSAMPGVRHQGGLLSQGMAHLASRQTVDSSHKWGITTLGVDTEHMRLLYIGAGEMSKLGGHYASCNSYVTTDCSRPLTFISLYSVALTEALTTSYTAWLMSTLPPGVFSWIRLARLTVSPIAV